MPTKPTPTAMVRVDEPTRLALRALAGALDCSAGEAIRRLLGIAWRSPGVPRKELQGTHR